MAYPITTQAQVRSSFWRDHPKFRPHYRKGKRQNSYNATIRSAFVEYVDGRQKSNQISSELADKVTL